MRSFLLSAVAATLLATGAVQAQAPAASPPPSTRRRSATWGRPPGLLDEDIATASVRAVLSAANAAVALPGR